MPPYFFSRGGQNLPPPVGGMPTLGFWAFIFWYVISVWKMYAKQTKIETTLLAARTLAKQISTETKLPTLYPYYNNNI